MSCSGRAKRAPLYLKIRNPRQTLISFGGEKVGKMEASPSPSKRVCVSHNTMGGVVPVPVALALASACAVVVSVVVPAFNAAGTIEAALRSVLSQTPGSAPFTCDVVVVDDCSSDGTCEVAALFAVAFAERDGWALRVLRRESNGGAAAARNAGVRAARGEWICMLDADDLCAVDRVSQLLDAALALPDARTTLFGSRFVRDPPDATPALPEYSRKDSLHLVLEYIYIYIYLSSS